MIHRFQIIGALALLGCAGSGPDPNNPNAPALEKRDTELEHESCDLDSGKGMDANGDKRPDIVKVFSGSREVCRAVDINMDGVIDVFVYYDDAGQQRRRESGFDRDTRPDQIAYYQAGQLVRKERETNNDERIDTWSYFEGGRLAREERDSTGDGYVDQWWTFNVPNAPDCAVVVTDSDGDGNPDKGSEVDLCKDGVSGDREEVAEKPDEPEEPAPTPDSEEEEAPPEGEEADPKSDPKGDAGKSPAPKSDAGKSPAPKSEPPKKDAPAKPPEKSK